MTPKLADPIRAAETEGAILEAARDLLAEGGLDALSMRAVAARVGVSATALYNYFDNKEALVNRVVTKGFERFDSYLREAIEDLPLGSSERLYALAEAYVSFALGNREYFKLIFTMQAERLREIDELPGGGGYALFRQTVIEAMESGAIRQADPDMVVLDMWTHAHGLVTLSLACKPYARCPHSGERLEAAELFKRLRDFMHHGLGATSAVETADIARS